MTSEFDPKNEIILPLEDEEEDFDVEEAPTLEDLKVLDVHFLKEPAEVIADFLRDFTENYERGIQGPIPMMVIHNMDRLSDMFNSSLSNPTRRGNISLQLSNDDLGQLATVVYLTTCGGAEEIVLGEQNHPPIGGQPLELAMLDLQEACIRAGGKDNPGLRKVFESLGVEGNQ